MSADESNQNAKCPNCGAILTHIYMRRGICPECGKMFHDTVDEEPVEPLKFHLGEILEHAWETWKDRVGFFLLLMLIMFLLNGAPQFFMEKLPAISRPFFTILVTIFNMLIALGQIKIFLGVAKGEEPELNDLVSQYGHFLQYLIASVLYAIIVIAGLVLFIIPGIIFLVQFQFFSFVIIDEDLGPVEALKRSSELTYNAKGQLLLFILVSFGISLLGFLALGIGLLIAIPVIELALAYIYLELKASTNPGQIADLEPEIRPANG